MAETATKPAVKPVTATATTEAKAEGTVEAKVSNRPVYGLGATLDELPESDKAGRALLYNDLLAKLKADTTLHGKWVEVAVFQTRQGAKTAQNAISKGERKIPAADDGCQWQFGSRVFNVDGAGTGGKRISKMYAKYGPTA